MATPLLNSLRTGKHKNLYNSDTTFAVYSTGFKALDAINAFMIPYKESNGNTKADVAEGIIGGRFVTIVGASGTGKSTLADQIGWNIVKPFPNGILIHVDCEQTVLAQRLYEIIGVDFNNSEDTDRIIIKQSDTYIEDVLTLINEICANKEALGSEVMYDAPGKWFGKKTVKLYEPTVVIIDSLPMFSSKMMDGEAIEGQMAVNRDIAALSQFYQKLLSKMNKYNITVIATNHIRPKIVVDVYNAPPPQLMLLNKSETLPKGQTPIYYASTIYRLNAAGKSAMFTPEDYGFSGFECTAQAAKSKSALIGAHCKMIFREDAGFDNAYTILATAYDNKMVQGRNPNLYIEGAPEFKFSRKDFGTKYNTNEEFRKAIDTAMEDVFKATVAARLDKLESLEKVDEKMSTSADGSVEG